MNVVLPKIVHILGLIAGAAAGVVLIVAAIMTSGVAYGVWGGIFIVSTILVAVGGGKAEPKIKPGKKKPEVGAKFKQVPDWVMYIVMGLFVVGIVVMLIVPPWS